MASFRIFALVLFSVFLFAPVQKLTGQQITWEQANPNDNGPFPIRTTQFRIDKKGIVFGVGISGAIYRSSNLGSSWIQDVGNEQGFYCIGIDSGTSLYAGSDHGLVVSNDNGDTWQHVLYFPHDSGSTYSTRNVEINNLGHVFAQCDTGVLISTDHAQTWKFIRGDTTTELRIAGNRIFLVNHNNQVEYSTDEGAFWRQGYHPQWPITDLQPVNDTGLWIASARDLGGDVFYSPNNGRTINIAGAQSSGNEQYYALTMNQAGDVFVAGRVQNVQNPAQTIGPALHRLKNGSKVWTSEITGLPKAAIQALATSLDGRLILSSDSGIFRTINSTLSAVSFPPEAAPGITVYPNPFHEGTNIQFNVRTSGHVRLEIFNPLGDRIATLEDGNLAAGMHNIKWDTYSGIPSGLYFIRLETAAGVQVRALTLH